MTICGFPQFRSTFILDFLLSLFTENITQKKRIETKKKNNDTHHSHFSLFPHSQKQRLNFDSDPQNRTQNPERETNPMAKTDVFDSDPAVVAKATELKKELQRLVRAIVDDEDCSTQKIDQAKETLSALKELKLRKRSLALKLKDILSCPEEFRCPISKELMRDPVIVSTGQVRFPIWSLRKCEKRLFL